MAPKNGTNAFFSKKLSKKRKSMVEMISIISSNDPHEMIAANKNLMQNTVMKNSFTNLWLLAA